MKQSKLTLTTTTTAAATSNPSNNKRPSKLRSRSRSSSSRRGSSGGSSNSPIKNNGLNGALSFVSNKAKPSSSSSDNNASSNKKAAAKTTTKSNNKPKKASPKTTEEMTIHLSTLESLRQSKRQQLESLFEQSQSIRKQMELLQNNLQKLDDEIETWECKIRKSVDGQEEGGEEEEMEYPMTMHTQFEEEKKETSSFSGTKKTEEEYVFQVTGEEEEGSNAKLSPTSGRLMTCAPDEVLTDPLTLTKNEEEEEDIEEDDDDDDEENEFTLTQHSKPQHKISSNENRNEKSTTRAVSSLEENDPDMDDIVDYYQDMEEEEEEPPPPPSLSEKQNSHTGKNRDLEEYIPDEEVDPKMQIHRASTASGLIPTNNINRHASLPNNSINLTSVQPQDAPPFIRASTLPSLTSTSRHFNQQQQQQQQRNMEQFTTTQRPTREDRNAAHVRQLAGDDFPWSQEMMLSLLNVFKIRSFRDHQKEIINCTMSGDDVFVIMRTGGGKSLTYQLPALLEGRGQERKVTVVISPLLSLIRDQEDQMNEFAPGSALSFTSGMAGGASEHHRRWGLVRDRNSGVVIIFVTPEKVHKSNKLRSELQKLHDQKRLGRIVIDECHCACQWGHDFRPDYTKLGVLKTMFPDVPLIAVTATASDRVRVDCCQILRLGTNYQFFRSSADRPNLKYSVREKADSKAKVVEDMAAFIKENYIGNAGIIYTFSRKEADEVADRLCELGIIARSYHSSISDSSKEKIHRSWMKNETQVVVATIAFGLGINKPDVRFVLHHSLSKSLESYYQESGRAGRDGEPADCVLYYSPRDVLRMLGMIHGENGENAFWSMARYGQRAGDDAVCRAIILNTLGEPACEDAEKVSRRGSSCSEERDVGRHAKVVTKLVSYSIDDGKDVALSTLVTDWRSKKPETPDFVKEYPPGKDITKDECERIIISLMIEDILHPKVIYTPYNTVVYITLGPRGSLLIQSENPVVKMHFPKRKSRAASKKTAVEQSDSGWITRKPSANRKNIMNGKGKSKAAATKKKGGRPRLGYRKRTSTRGYSQDSEVIELDISSDEASDSPRRSAVKKKRKLSNSKGKDKALEIWEDSSDSDFD